MTKVVHYETNFYDWALYNAQLLREGRFSEIDVEHIAEELESLGKKDRREIISRFKILLGYLLKWQYQPDYRGRSWRGSIIEQRSEIKDLIAENPSLKPYQQEAVITAYPKAVGLATQETGLNVNVFPSTCPYTMKEILDDQFFPENRSPSK